MTRAPSTTIDPPSSWKAGAKLCQLEGKQAGISNPPESEKHLTLRYTVKEMFNITFYQPSCPRMPSRILNGAAACSISCREFIYSYTGQHISMNPLLHHL
jgi:hypothetical protein